VFFSILAPRKFHLNLIKYPGGNNRKKHAVGGIGYILCIVGMGHSPTRVFFSIVAPRKDKRFQNK
jgi:hypothetical protein